VESHDWRKMKDNNTSHAAATSFAEKAPFVCLGASLDIVKNRTVSAPDGSRTQNLRLRSRSRIWSSIKQRKTDELVTKK
jgi:hypothetical protein